VFPDDALRAALQTPRRKKRAIRSAMRISRDRIEVLKEEAEGKTKPKSKEGPGVAARSCNLKAADFASPSSFT